MEIGGTDAICTPCADAFERFKPPWCPRCGRPFHSQAALSHFPAHVCAPCQQDDLHYDKARAIGAFEGSLRELVHLLKFGGVTKLARALAPHLADLATSEFGVGEETPNVILTHVPIDPARWRTRGFDQALLLSLQTAEHLGKPHARLLERAKPGRSQTGLSGRERRRNMRGVFRVRSGGVREKLASATCILIDDVVTTGSTASACARELKKSGANAVHLLTICRA